MAERVGIPIQTESPSHDDRERRGSNCFTVVKRDGTIVPFRRERIFRAINLAFHAKKKAFSLLDEELTAETEKVTDRVVDLVLALAVKGASLTVEGIQDLVEVTLMKMGHYEVARGYIVYRDQHKALREDSPNHLKLYRHDGSLVRFNPIKIASAIEKAFRRGLSIDGQTSLEITEMVNDLTEKVINQIMALHKARGPLYLSMVEDEVEQILMKEGYYLIAKDYILFRAAKATSRPPPDTTANQGRREFSIITAEGNSRILKEQHLYSRIKFSCRDLPEVSPEELLEVSILHFYEGMKEFEIDKSLIMAARTKIEIEPAYSKVAARLLADLLYREAMQISASDGDLDLFHKNYFKQCIKLGISVHRLNPLLFEFDLDRLAEEIDLKRDDLFSYLGLQTLYDRYCIQHEERRIETPQIFWMRIAMGLALNEKEQKNERAIEFYHVLSQFFFTSSTPTLFNSGTLRPQLSSCYLSTVMDDLGHIFKVIADNAQLSKWAGGIGNDWSNVRGTGSVIKGTNGKSQGIIPFLKVANDTAVAVNQGGKRKGAMCAYLETWHLDIEEFLELRKNTGDDRRRAHDMNTANWIPDLFMKRVLEDGVWTLFSPSDTPDLHDLYGIKFENRYLEYEGRVNRGLIKLYKQIKAVDLWRKMLSMLFETGHPWITFKDPSNIRSSQDHVGVIHSSNLCTEILLNTSAEETAVCNLGSINLFLHCTKSGLDEEKLASTVRTAVRMLDNVVDINFYPTSEAENSNRQHRPIGLGVMGFQDALYLQRISYASHEAVEFADISLEMVSYYAILASTELANERGKYPSYPGSKWDRGYLPIDTLDLLATERGGFLEVNRTVRMDWDVVRKAIKERGMRNSNMMAIAPTATISNITGITQSVEPMYKHLFVKSNLSGEFTVINTFLVNDLKAIGLWDQKMLDDLKYSDGSIAEIDRIPDEIKHRYPSAFEVDPEWIIEAASRRQKWLCMGQSLNFYIVEPSGKRLHDMYFLAWIRGLKTTYYLRSVAATQVEKSATDINKRGLQPRWMKSKSASSHITVERGSCRIDDESCESCQ